MSFKFNFSNNHASDKVIDKQKMMDKKVGASATCKAVTWQNNKLAVKEGVAHKSLMVSDGTSILYTDPEQIERQILEDMTYSGKSDASDASAVQQAINQHTDLIPGVYEGGLKVWECSIDLVDYLARTNMKERCKDKPLCVLELGCGAGLPGIYMLIHGASVHFQDYNSEVLSHLTMPSVALNLEDLSKRQAVQFYAGDWNVVCKMLKDKHLEYDVILTAETIYNIESYPKLHDLFDSLLHEQGEIYVAAKSYYFGVGGGTQQFTEYVNKRGQFCVEQCFVTDTGVKREILHLKRRQRMMQAPS